MTELEALLFKHKEELVVAAAKFAAAADSWRTRAEKAEADLADKAAEMEAWSTTTQRIMQVYDLDKVRELIGAVLASFTSDSTALAMVYPKLMDLAEAVRRSEHKAVMLYDPQKVQAALAIYDRYCLHDLSIDLADLGKALEAVRASLR